jgi:hypothetical protein
LIENLCLAYQNIPADNNQADRQIKVKRELASAKLDYPNINSLTNKNLEKANLLEDWNQPTFIKSYLEIYDSPSYAKADFDNIVCGAPEGNLSEKRRCLNKLFNSCQVESSSNNKQEYIQIYINFISKDNCLTASEKNKWNQKWFPQQ